MAIDLIFKHNGAAYQAMAFKTLDAMWEGGLFDHLAGGFARYSTDRRWLVPHFEKMLYDNAQLASIYFDGYMRSGQPGYRVIAEETLDYLLNDMADPGEAFTPRKMPIVKAWKESFMFLPRKKLKSA